MKDVTEMTIFQMKIPKEVSNQQDRNIEFKAKDKEGVWACKNIHRYICYIQCNCSLHKTTVINYEEEEKHPDVVISEWQWINWKK